jgi:hypothetical protein
MPTAPANPHETLAVKPASSSAARIASALWLAALAAVLSLQVWFPRIDAAVNDTYNVDVGGRNALYQYARRRMGNVSRNHEPLANRLDRLDVDTTLCLLGPARYPSPREWQALITWVNHGGTLLVASRWNDADLPVPGIEASVKSTVVKKPFKLPGSDKRKKKSSGPPSADETSQSEEDEIRNMFSAKTAAAVPVTTTLVSGYDFTWKTEGIIEAPLLNAARGEVLVKSAAGPQAMRIHHGQGTILLVASDFIFSNAALNEHGHTNAILAVKLLEAAGTTDAIVFDESLNETGTPKVVGMLLDPILRPITIQLVALIVLFGWRGNRRFGGVLPKMSPPRHDVADHTNSLGNLYYKAHHGTGVLREYFEQLKTELRLRYVAGHERRILLPIAQKANMTFEEVQRVLAEAEAATKNPKLSRREAAAHIRKLALLRQAARTRHSGV